MKTNKNIKQTQKFKALLNELEGWIAGSDQNGGLEFAFRNGFLLHAVNLWQGSGASELPGVRIPRRLEELEIKALLEYADIFICPSCNHNSFFSPGEIEEDETQCESCLKTMKIDSRGKS